MRASRALLLRLYHDPAFDFGKACIEYLDRGAPGDRSKVMGAGIASLQSGWMEVESETGIKFIPYHRIRRISYQGSVMWEKNEGPKKAPGHICH